MDKEKRLEELRRELENYEDLASELDEDAYVARGNGFCDAKFSDNFIEGQILRIKEEIERLQS